MKYELDPDNRNCEDEVLLDDLRRVAARLSKPSLTKDDYDEHGRFCAATMRKRFGSWNKALELSGLSVTKRVNIPRHELLGDLKRVAQALRTETISVESYNSCGRFSEATIARAFGSWVKALAAAELCVSSAYRPKVTDDELLSNMAIVWEKVGRQPQKKDFRPPYSHFSANAYVRRYGSWRNALESFVVVANAVGTGSEAGSPVGPSPMEPVSHIKKQTPRDPGWRLRFLVMRRDRFTCQTCGRTPALDPGVILHVDHVVPWDNGGETTVENLQTLCRECNIGKGDLSMENERGSRIW